MTLRRNMVIQHPCFTDSPNDHKHTIIINVRLYVWIESMFIYTPKNVNLILFSHLFMYLTTSYS